MDFKAAEKFLSSPLCLGSLKAPPPLNHANQLASSAVSLISEHEGNGASRPPGASPPTAAAVSLCPLGFLDPPDVLADASTSTGRLWTRSAPSDWFREPMLRCSANALTASPRECRDEATMEGGKMKDEALKEEPSAQGGTLKGS